MTTRRVIVGDIEQIITTNFSRDEQGHVTEHVTLETPKPTSDTQRVRAQSMRDFGKTK